MELKLYFRDVKQPQDSDLNTVLFQKYCENYFYTNCLAEQPRANYFVSNLKMLLAPSLTCPLFQDKLFLSKTAPVHSLPACRDSTPEKVTPDQGV